MKFSDLNLSNPILNALVDLEYKTPTTIQEKVLPVAMSGKDVVGIAQTGTGKTIAYLLPSLRLWKFSKNKFAQILILVPTRELVVQVVEEVKKLTTYMNVEVVGVFGGVKMDRHTQLVEAGVDVLIATPGRLMDLVLSGSLNLKAIKQVVIDEVDEMLDLGFRHQLLNVFEMLPPKRQNLMFSATITDDVERLINNYFISPIRVEAAPTGTPLTNIEQRTYRIPNFNTKVNLLKLLLIKKENMSRVLIFTATKALADQLFNQISEKMPNLFGVIHSNKAQNKRFSTVVEFGDGTIKYLIATDIIARGIDISEVTHVINFDVPTNPENYMHRIGRTGRANRKGQAITFVSEQEETEINAIELLMNLRIETVDLPEDLIISNVLTKAEMPQIKMKSSTPKLPSKPEGLGAFHEKKAKNAKTENIKSYQVKIKNKYKKPKTRGQKK